MLFSNAQSYALNTNTKYLFESEDEEEWEFRGSEIVRSNYALIQLKNQ